MTKTFSNRSNAKRAIAAFRDKHPDLVGVGLALVPTGTAGKSGDAQTIEATGVMTKYASDAVEAAGFTMPPAKAKANKAKAEHETSNAEVAKVKTERKAKKAEARANLEKALERPLTPKPERKPRVAKAPKEAKAPLAKRDGTKQDLVIGLLQRARGATVPEIMEETGWLPHTTRAFVSATVGKKLGHKVETEKDDKRGRVYRIAA